MYEDWGLSGVFKKPNLKQTIREYTRGIHAYL